MTLNCNLRLAGASQEAATYACLNWHYAKRVPKGKLLRIGVWEHESYRGVVLFGSGSAGVGAIYKRFGLAKTSVCELQRIALRSHVTPVTRIVSIALRLLRAACPKLELVVSYADPQVGHTGKIYHAGNWVNAGMSAADTAYRYLDGEVRHSRSVSKTGVKSHFGKVHRARKPADAIEVIALQPKHKFLYPLTENAKARVKQAMAGHPPDQRRGSTDPHAPKTRKGGAKAALPSSLGIGDQTRR